MNLDLTYFKKEGVLSEKDYNSISGKITKVINPLRVNDIRKNMEFFPVPYLDYTKESKQEFLFEGGSFSIPLDLDFVSFPLLCSFNSNFFPNFEAEYLNPEGRVDFVDGPVNLSEEGGKALKNLPNGNFHSLAIAAYNLEKEIKNLYPKTNLWKISEDITVIIEFFVPTVISCNFDLTVKVIITIYLN